MAVAALNLHTVTNNQALKSKVAIVTGASSGIGYAIAKALAKNGAKVGLLARRLNRLELLEQEIISEGGEALAIQCDVVDRAQVFEAVEKVRQKLGKIDILVNNAGVVNLSMTYNIDVDSWLQVVDVNVIGTLHCYAATLQDMMDKRSGHIINISSLEGRSCMPSFSAYAGSKHFMQGHSAGIRQELAPLGIKVTVLQPGATKTDMLAPPDDQDVLRFLSTVPQFQEMSKATILECEDVAKAAVFALTQKDRVGINQILMEPKTVVFNSN